MDDIRTVALCVVFTIAAGTVCVLSAGILNPERDGMAEPDLLVLTGAKTWISYEDASSPQDPMWAKYQQEAEDE